MKIIYKIKETLLSQGQIFMTIIPVVIGIAGGLAAVFLRFLIHFFQDIFWTKGLIENSSTLRIILIPVIIAFIVGIIVKYFSSEAKGHGVPEVMVAIALKKGIMKARVILGKTIASALTIASGGSVGREGPIVQIGAAIGSFLGQFFKISPRKMKAFVGCGAAAGIAAAFNAPIAGAMFSVEILLGEFTVSQFTPIVISSVSATVISRMFYGNHPAFIVPKYELVNFIELIPYALLGVICGLVAILYIKVLDLFEDKFDNSSLPEYIKTSLGGLLIGIIGLSFPQVFGVGYKAMGFAMNGKMGILLLFVLIFMKILATSLTLGSGCSGGIFAPALFIGTMTGGFFGSILHRFFPAYTAGAGAYAMVAMSALVAAATHAPITAILIIFEMTSNYRVILPLMIATTISTMVSNRLHKNSIYTHKLQKQGINIHEGKEMNILKNFKVKDIMRESLPKISPQANISEIIETFLNSKHNYLYVIDEEGNIIGRITQTTMNSMIRDYDNLKNIALAEDIAGTNPVIVKPSDRLDYIMKTFGKENIGEIPVCENVNGKNILYGTVWRVDLIELYNKELMKKDLEGELSTLINTYDKEKKIKVIDNLYLLKVFVPKKFIGKTIAELNIRNNYGIDILMIKSLNSGDKAFMPNAGHKFVNEEEILIIGEYKDLEKFEFLAN